MRSCPFAHPLTHQIELGAVDTVCPAILSIWAVSEAPESFLAVMVASRARFRYNGKRCQNARIGTAPNHPSKSERFKSQLRTGDGLANPRGRVQRILLRQLRHGASVGAGAPDRVALGELSAAGAPAVPQMFRVPGRHMKTRRQRVERRGKQVRCPCCGTKVNKLHRAWCPGPLSNYQRVKKEAYSMYL